MKNFPSKYGVPGGSVYEMWISCASLVDQQIGCCLQGLGARKKPFLSWARLLLISLGPVKESPLRHFQWILTLSNYILFFYPRVITKFYYNYLLLKIGGKLLKSYLSSFTPLLCPVFLHPMDRHIRLFSSVWVLLRLCRGGGTTSFCSRRHCGLTDEVVSFPQWERGRPKLNEAQLPDLQPSVPSLEIKLLSSSPFSHCPIFLFPFAVAIPTLALNCPDSFHTACFLQNPVTWIPCQPTLKVLVERALSEQQH